MSDTPSVEAPTAPPAAALPAAPAAPGPAAVAAPAKLATKESRLAAVRAGITARSAPPAPAAPPPAAAEGEPAAAEEGDDAPPATLAEALAEKGADEPVAEIDDRALAAIQRREHGARAAIDEAREQSKAEIERRRGQLEQEWKPRIEKAEAHEKFEATARYDVTAYEEKLKDHSAEDRARLGALLWHGAAAELETDPGKKAEAQKQVKALRDKHKDSTRTTQLEKQLADLQAERKAEKFEQKVSTLTTAASKAVSAEKHPIVAALLKRSPESAQDRLAFAAKYIFEQTGREPSPTQLLEQVEQAEAENLKRFHPDPYQALGLKTTPPKAAPLPPKQNTNPARETQEANPAAPATAKDVPGQAATPPRLLSKRDRLNHARGLR